MKKYYKIAGLIVTMETFDYNEWITRPYQIDPVENIDFSINTEWKYLKERYPDMPDSMCYLNAAGKIFYHNLIKYNGMMLHSSAAVVDGKAYLFSADPGTGKSTHTMLWRRVFGDERVRILNDDKPAIRYEEGIWYAYGTPWSGKTSQNLNLKYPIGGVAFLTRGIENKIETYTENDLVYQFLKQTPRPKDLISRNLLLSNIENLIEKIPVWKLCCNMETEAALISYEAMSGQEKKERLL